MLFILHTFHDPHVLLLMMCRIISILVLRKSKLPKGKDYMLLVGVQTLSTDKPVIDIERFKICSTFSFAL